MYHSLFIHSRAEEHPGCFQLWAVINKAAMNICGQVFCVAIHFYCFELISRSETAGLYGKHMVKFIRNDPAVFPRGCTICILTSSEWECPLCHIHAHNWCGPCTGRGPFSYFNSHFPEDLTMWSIFSCAYLSSVCLLWWGVYKGP